MMNNYINEMIDDINDFMNYDSDCINWDDITDRDDLETTLNDELFCSDSVTGNASGSYYCNAYKAKEKVLANIDECKEALTEFCASPEEIANHFLNEDWEYFDIVNISWHI